MWNITDEEQQELFWDSFWQKIEQASLEDIYISELTLKAYFMEYSYYFESDYDTLYAELVTASGSIVTSIPRFYLSFSGNTFTRNLLSND